MIFLLLFFNQKFFSHWNEGGKIPRKQFHKKTRFLFSLSSKEEIMKKKFMGKFIPNGNESTFSSENFEFFAFFHSTFAHFLIFSVSKATANTKKNYENCCWRFFVSFSSEKYINKEGMKKSRDSVEITMWSKKKRIKKN